LCAAVRCVLSTAGTCLCLMSDHGPVRRAASPKTMVRANHHRSSRVPISPAAGKERCPRARRRRGVAETARGFRRRSRHHVQVLQRMDLR
jgi:hypothetical protein